MGQDFSRRGFMGVATLGGLALVGTVAGCTPPSQTAGPTGPIRKGGTLTVGQVGYGTAENMNLSFVSSGVDILRQSLIREGLWQYRGTEFGVENVLAESQQVSADGMTLSVKLREGVTWHNGKDFTADDVVWSIQQWPTSPAVSSMATLLDLPRLKKTGPLTVDIGLAIPLANFPGIAAANWSTYIIQNGTGYEDPTYLGTGPFKFESFQPGKAVFVANTNYWGAGPYLDRVISDSSFTDDQARTNALQAGLIDAMPIVPYTVASSIATSGIQLLTSPSPGFLTMSVRVDQPPFNDKRVIEAMKLLVDRESVVNSVYAGHASVGNDLGMKGAPYYASDLTRSYDPDKAKSLIKSAGAEGIQGSIITSSFYPGATELATIYAQQATAVGLDIRVKTIDSSDFYNTSGPNAYLQRSLGMNSWNASTLDGFYFLGLNTKAPYNDTHWGSDDSDKLLFDAMAEQDPGKAADKWHAVQQEQFDQGGYIIPAHQNYIDAVGPKVQGLTVTPSGCDFNNYKFNEAWLSS